MEAPVPKIDPGNIEARIDAARVKFRRHRSSLDDRRDAIRDLADVLEFLRPKLKNVLTSKDESDLFNLANNFGIRHHNEAQKVQYDKPIWYSWLFYYYLATIHAVVRLIDKASQQRSPSPGIFLRNRRGRLFYLFFLTLLASWREILAIFRGRRLAIRFSPATRTAAAKAR